MAHISFLSHGITDVVLRRHLSSKVIANNRDLLHYVVANFGYLVEEEERENAADNAEGGCGDAAEGTKSATGEE